MASTEPDAGSDVAAITTTAVKEGDDYVINGNKIFITNGTVAKYLLVLCVTNPKEQTLRKENDCQGPQGYLLATGVGPGRKNTKQEHGQDEGKKRVLLRGEKWN